MRKRYLMQHIQFITAFIIRNRYRAIKSKSAITVCVRLKKSIFLCATVSRIVSVTDIIHLLSVIWHTTSTRTYRIISAAAQKPNPNPCGPGSVYVCTVRNRSCVISICYIAKWCSTVLVGYHKLVLLNYWFVQYVFSTPIWLYGTGSLIF